MDDRSASEALNHNPNQPFQPQNFLVITDDYFVHPQSPVSPPTHHEDLPVQPPEVHSSDKSESSESSSPATSERPAVSDFRSRAVGEAIRRYCEILKAKVISGIFGFGFGFGSYAASLCSVIRPVTAITAALLVLSLFLLKTKMLLPWRRRTVAVRRDNEERLFLLIKHKDEKINQLLVQIGQMNETISARRRVPVVRIK